MIIFIWPPSQNRWFCLWRHLSVWRAETATCSPPTTEQEDRDLRPGHMTFPLDQFRTRVWLGWTGPMQDPGAK
jgi:hypothetical protein